MKNVFVVLGVVLVIGGCASDGDAIGQATWQAVVEHILEVVVVIATPILLILARKLIQLIEKKWGFDISERQELLVSEWLSKGIAYAHEQGRNALKYDEKPLPGHEKKVMAVDFVAAGLKASGIITLSRDALEKLVESKLNVERAADDTVAPSSKEEE